MHKTILFYFGHPAQYLFAKNTIKRLIKNEHDIIILIKTKDVLEKLLKDSGLPYHNILSEGRRDSKIGILWGLLKRNWRLFWFLRKQKRIDLMVGTDPSLAHIGRILHIPVVTTLEDDYEVIKNLAKLTYPYTNTILCPNVCKVGDYEKKKVGYEGYMKLGYLHPNVFKPDSNILSKYNIPSKFVLIRISNLKAHHDFGVKGITSSLLDELIKKCETNNYSVFISSEARLDKSYDTYLLRIRPSDIHHILAHATLLISDSQSMSVEAAVLGIPSIRFSSFAGKISVLEELEHKYQLTYGVDPSNPDALLKKVQELLAERELKSVFIARKEEMLQDKIDVTAFLVWFIGNYPSSSQIMRVSPDYQYRFK